MTAERLLHGLVDDTHAAATDLAQDAEVAQTLRTAVGGAGSVGGKGVGAIGGRLEPFHDQQGGEEFADVVGQLGMAFGVLGERGPFAAAAALGELLRQILNRVALGVRRIHGCLACRTKPIR